ncbi:MAG: hypothetical protein AVDCRST_MAG73-178, partial [uncultured Thermomicrobiales bacterium]
MADGGDGGRGDEGPADANQGAELTARPEGGRMIGEEGPG